MMIVNAVNHLKGAPGLQCTLNHLARQFRLGRKADGVMYLGCQVVFLAICLLPGQIEFAVDQKPTLVAGLGEKHADLTVLNPACSAAVPPQHADRLGNFLQEARLILRQYRIGIGRVFQPLACPPYLIYPV